MSEEITEFVPYECSLGTVTGVEGSTYIITTIDGRCIGITANGDPSEANVESDIANPPAPVVAVPAKVTRRQLFLALLAHDASLTRANLRASLAGNEAALIEFDEAIEFERSHPLVASLAASLGMSEADADNLFVIAATL